MIIDIILLHQNHRWDFYAPTILRQYKVINTVVIDMPQALY